jgi:hypothetical protein
MQMLNKFFTWVTRLFAPLPKEAIDMQKRAVETNKVYEQALKKTKRPRLYKQAVVVTKGELPQPKEKKMATKPGLYSNIHKKQERIEQQKASGAKKVETMRKPGTKGAPTAAAFKAAAKTAKK